MWKYLISYNRSQLRNPSTASHNNCDSPPQYCLCRQVIYASHVTPCWFHSSHAPLFSLLVLSIFFSALGIGLSTIVLNVMPQIARPTVTDTIAFLSNHMPAVFLAGFLVPVGSVFLAVLCVLLWSFLVYRVAFAITLTVICGLMILAFFVLFFKLVHHFKYRTTTFEAFIKEKRFQDGWDFIINQDVKPSASRAISRVRNVAWMDSDQWAYYVKDGRSRFSSLDDGRLHAG